MEQHRTFRVGFTVILISLLLRLFLSGIPQRLVPLLRQRAQEVILLLEETGRNVRFSPSMNLFFPDFVETPAPSLPEPTEPPIPVFSELEAAELYNAAKVAPDITALLTQPLDWDLKTEAPAVLILHTHATESYTRKKEAYKESASWRTLDENYNMLAIGDMVAGILEEAGIPVIHDRTLHDRPSYDRSYVAARKAIQQHLEENPGIQLVLDIHRDAAERSYGQLRTKAILQGQRSAQLMVVIGTNHEGYEQNLGLGLKLHAQLERQAPGITRPLQLRSARYNQDLCPGALIVEVGAAGNTHPEARLAAQQLGQAVIALARGTD